MQSATCLKSQPRRPVLNHPTWQQPLCPSSSSPINFGSTTFHLPSFPGWRKMAGNEDWRKRADTTKMSNEDIKAAGVEGSKRPPGQNPGGVLHQRRRLPYSTTTMAVTGFVITAAVGYFVLYAKKKPEATAGDVARVATGTADPRDTHPRK